MTHSRGTACHPNHALAPPIRRGRSTAMRMPLTGPCTSFALEVNTPPRGPDHDSRDARQTGLLACVELPISGQEFARWVRVCGVHVQRPTSAAERYRRRHR